MTGKKKHTSTYDRTEVYDKQIKPVVLQLNALCVAHNIPFYMLFAVANDDEAGTTEYIKEGSAPDTHNLVLNDDYFTKIMAVGAGCRVVTDNVADAPEEVPDDIVEIITDSEGKEENT